MEGVKAAASSPYKSRKDADQTRPAWRASKREAISSYISGN